MNLIHLTLAFICIFSVSCGEEINDKDRDKPVSSISYSGFWQPDTRAFMLSGDVEWIEERNKVWFDGGPVAMDGFYYRFNEVGFKMQQKRFGRNNTLMAITNYEHDPEGLPVKSSTLNEAGQILMKGEFEYDESDRTLNFKTFETGNPVPQMITRQKFDEKGYLLTEEFLNSAGELMEKTAYTRNDKGWIMKEDRLEADGHLEFQQKNTYDEKGNLIEAIRLDAHSGVWTNTFLYEFDDKGNWKIRKTLLNGKVVEEAGRTYKYR